jgi:hypothetical protein
MIIGLAGDVDPHVMQLSKRTKEGRWVQLLWMGEERLDGMCE